MHYFNVEELDIRSGEIGQKAPSTWTEVSFEKDELKGEAEYQRLGT